MRNELILALILVILVTAGCTFRGAHWTDAAGNKWQAVPLTQFATSGASAPAPCMVYSIRMLDDIGPASSPASNGEL